MSVGVPCITLVEVGLGEYGYLFLACRFHEDLSITNDDLVTRFSDDALDVMLLVVGRWTKDDNVTSYGISQEVSELVDDDVLAIFQRREHRVSFYLKGGDEECSNGDDHSHDDDDVEGDVEEMPKDASLFHHSRHTLLQPTQN